MWEHEIIEYKNFLKLERSLSDNSVSAYVNDINKLTSFLKLNHKETIEYSTSSGNHYAEGEIVSQVVSDGITVKAEVQTVTKTSDTAGTITVSNIGVSGTEKATSFIVSNSIGLIELSSGRFACKAIAEVR